MSLLHLGETSSINIRTWAPPNDFEENIGISTFSDLFHSSPQNKSIRTPSSPSCHNLEEYLSSMEAKFDGAKLYDQHLGLTAEVPLVSAVAIVWVSVVG